MDGGAVEDRAARRVPRLRKRERREQILLELKLRPHLRIAELAERFGVSTETVRRDFDALSAEGLLARAHGGGSAPARGAYPGLDERNRSRLEQRERVGRLAARLVRPGDTLMLDSGSTTLQMARFLAWQGTACTVLTNSLPVAMTLGQSAAIRVLMCPGDYLASESAVIGPETVAFLAGHSVARAFIGAAGLDAEEVSEAVPGYAAIKRTMLARAEETHLLIDSGKLGRRALAAVCAPSELASVIVDAPPPEPLHTALARSGTAVMVAS